MNYDVILLLRLIIVYIEQEEKGLFNFHLSNLEFACGAKLNNVSSTFIHGICKLMLTARMLLLATSYAILVQQGLIATFST